MVMIKLRLRREFLDAEPTPRLVSIRAPRPKGLAAPTFR
jgi:hypothetical protein